MARAIASQRKKKALRWLDVRCVAYTIRPIVDEPPTELELAAWVGASGKPVLTWLNTSGQSQTLAEKRCRLGDRP